MALTFQKANIVEHGQASRANKTNFVKGKESKNGRGFNLGSKGRIIKKKFQGNYYNCDKPGHHVVNCRLPKREKAKETNFMDDIARDVSGLDLVAIIL
ncbi:hypothetical protein OSB04_un001087 [Centaurea solstitialis]|uniref:CCHC-type domain-containing protein n=1 Tax=Centaurea solstitialis TaxID=347529 RepID=A0AA38W210_9ASTR|nr:hypothetical protein OSB04_un001087 [Centaurea solstitialis]